MISFPENPNLGLETVTTINNVKEYRINCRKIKDEYHIVNKDCFLIDKKWYRVNSGLITFDYEKKEWVIIKNNPNLISGIVGFTKGVPLIGKFTPNLFNNIEVKSSPGGSKTTALNADILVENGYIENLSEGVFYHSSLISVGEAQKIKNVISHTGKGYNIEENVDEYATKVLLRPNYKPALTKNYLFYASVLGQTTFGLEIEASAGYLPEYIQYRTGTVICRDGSLKDEDGNNGPEFVTIPLSGITGLQTINILGNELPKRTRLGLNCSFHIHFGTIPTTRIYLVSLYRLCCKIQNEIFTMFPYYKANPDGIKNKNYNQKLPSLNMIKANEKMSKEEFESYVDKHYKQLYSWLAEGYMPDKKRNRKNGLHPVNHKWDRTKRYYWINFMNTIFGNRNTVEFRLHGPTTNSIKMQNWLFICNAILKFALHNPRKILLSNEAISLLDVLGYYEKFGEKGVFLKEYLDAYIKDRKKVFSEDYKKGDFISSHEFLKDNEYNFTYKGVDKLF